MKRLLNQLWIVIGAVVAAFVVSWGVYMPDAQERGVWRSAHNGMILSLSPLTAKLYSATAASCVHDLTFPAHLKLVELAEGATVEVIDNNLHLNVDGSLEPLVFEPIAALPDNCTTPNPNTAPLDTFNVLWSAMKDHYAFFDLHGVDWDARRALAPTNAETLTDEALLALLSDTLEGLDDGHVQLGTPLGYYSPALAPDWLAEGLTRDSLMTLAVNTIGTPLTAVDLTGIQYTVLPDNIGYVLIRHMSINTPFGARSEPAMAQAFSQVADAMANAKAIIIDIRYNPGGSDSVAFGIASHFTDQPVDVFTKTTRDGAGQTAPFTATLQPFDTTPLNQPVIVLTSQMTGSAAEILTMALRELPQVTTMGEATSGGLSDIFSVTLPNGWDLGLSHQTYRAMDGQSFEAVGIPPDISFAITAEPLMGGEDPLLRAAFARLRDQ